MTLIYIFLSALAILLFEDTFLTLKAAKKEASLKKRFGAKKSFISRIENGQSDIQLSTLYRLLEFGLGKKVELKVL